MSVQAAALRPLPMRSDYVLEELSRAASAFTVAPVKSAVFYLFPALGAFFSSYHPLRVDPSLEAMMPLADTEPMLKEIDVLTDCAGIKGGVLPYVALNHTFSHYGGSCSFTQPILFIPEQHLFRRAGQSPFPQEQPNEQLKEQEWVFSDDETRFLIVRELNEIKTNSTLLKVAIKVAILAFFFTIYATPFTWPVGFVLFIGAIGLYFISERYFQGQADLMAVEILEKRIPNAKQVAIDTLEKVRQQNLYRRESSHLARLYMTESGNNLLDFRHPFLTSRIAKVTECAKNS